MASKRKKNPAAVALGRLGGAVKSAAKTRAARANIRKRWAREKRGSMIVDKHKDYGANIIEDPRRPGKLYVKVYHAGVVYKRRAASLAHARDLVHAIKAAIVKGDWSAQAETAGRARFGGTAR